MAEPYVVGDTEVQPGARGFGQLHVGHLAAGTPVTVPFQIIHGAMDGPVLCYESTMHGWEPVGAEIIRRAMLRIKPQELRGTIVCLPLAVPMSVEFGGTVESAGMRVNPGDALDINKVWPGKAKNAWLTEQIAYVIWNQAIKHVDYIVDMHDGTGSCEELPVAFPHAFPPAGKTPLAGGVADGTGSEISLEDTGLTRARMDAINSRIEGMAKAFGSRIIWWRENPVNPSMLSGHCAIHGIIPLVVEAGGACALDYCVDEGAECLLNIARHLDMIEGELVLAPQQTMVSRYVVYRSLTGGYYIPAAGVELGATVARGQPLGEVVDPVTSEVRERCESPVNGVIVSRRVKLPMNPGGYVAHIADLDSTLWQRDNRQPT